MAAPKDLQTRWLELAVAALFALAGAIVMADSVRVGTGWGDEGPQAGYFPFRIACVLLGGAAVVIVQTLRGWRGDGGRQVFASWAEARLMLTMLLPMVAYVARRAAGPGRPNGVAILLPLTFTMTRPRRSSCCPRIYWGALFGGAITSILFNIPGEPWSVATTFDGHPMAQQGKAARR
jgi:hypothetical protein